jgi:plastocyanin
VIRTSVNLFSLSLVTRAMTMPGRRWRMPALVALLASAALVASQAAAAGGEPAASSSEAHATARISEFKFKPFKLTVARGAEVRWVNHDSTAHEPSKAGSFDTGPIAPGKAESVRFTKPGTYRYICAIHPFMHGKIIVRR